MKPSITKQIIHVGFLISLVLYENHLTSTVVTDADLMKCERLVGVGG